MRISTRSFSRDLYTSILSSPRQRIYLLSLAALLIALVSPARAGWEEASTAWARGDYRAAFEESLPLARAGDPVAQFVVGLMYDLGDGVTQDDVEAVEWYRRAAEQGVVEAQYYLALMQLNGEGVLQNYAEAIKWFRRAAEQAMQLRSVKSA
jgi:TPR repeat protein